jgi:cellulose synthase (UDP-forming)
MISDLVFSNSDQWVKFQLSRRNNIGILKGTIWFFGVALFQTGRGLTYLIRSLKREKPAVPVVVTGKAA